MVLFTIGHGRLPQEAFVRLLRHGGITRVVDVRRYPGSRRHPQYGRKELEHWLPAAGIAYRWLPQLGGRRRGGDRSPHTALANPSFRAYAEHMGGEEFRTTLTGLLRAAEAQMAIMCAEGDWRRCHRRLIADAATLLWGVTVRHLRHDGEVEDHVPSPAARVHEGSLVYDGGEPSLTE